jgi:phosphoglycolate phosphatase-like HAD superfamily hydrolase
LERTQLFTNKEISTLEVTGGDYLYKAISKQEVLYIGDAVTDLKTAMAGNYE